MSGTLQSYERKDIYVEDTASKEMYYQEYLPATQVNYNQQSSQIKVQMDDKHLYVLPSQSYIKITGTLTKSDGGLWADTDNVTLINNALMYLFSACEYRLNGNSLEIVREPGRLTSMMGYLKYNENFQRGYGLNQLWQKDSSNTAAIATNTGFAIRQGHIIINSTPKGSFSFCVPMSHIFGFCEDYDKVITSYSHELILTRAGDNDAIFRGVVAPVDTAGKVTINYVGWYMPVLTPSLVVESGLVEQQAKNEPLTLAYRSREGVSYNVPQNSTNFSWPIVVDSGKGAPRYVLIAFQTDKLNTQTSNPALFDNVNVQSLNVQFNGMQVPRKDYDLNFAAQDYSRAFHDAATFPQYYYGMSELAGQAGVNMVDFKSLFTVYAFDCSNQPSVPDSTPVTTKLVAQFRSAIPANTLVYAVLITDTKFQITANGPNVTKAI